MRRVHRSDSSDNNILFIIHFVLCESESGRLPDIIEYSYPDKKSASVRIFKIGLSLFPFYVSKFIYFLDKNETK